MTARIKGEDVCPACREWQIKAGDTFCGFCGEFLLGVTYKPNRIVLIEDVLESKRIVFSNPSQRPLGLEIREGRRTLSALAFDRSSLQLPAGKLAQLQARLDPQRLPPTFKKQTLDYSYRIQSTPPIDLPLPVEVRSRARPYAEPNPLDFGQLREGDEHARVLTVRNDGGNPIRLREIEVHGSKEIVCRLAKDLPIALGPEDHLDVDVVWLPTEAEQRTRGIELRLHFETRPEPVVVPVRAQRHVFFAEPSAIKVDPFLSKHPQTHRILIENSGGPPVKVKAFTTDQEWLQVVTRDASPTIEPDRDHEFEVLIRGKNLEQGAHTGALHVEIEGEEAKPLTISVDINALKPEVYEDYIGIDFGTTNSVVAILDSASPDGIDLVREPGQETALIPSVLTFLSGPDSFLVGAQAELQADPAKTVRSIKRVLGAREEHEFFGRQHKPEVIASLIVRYLVSLAEKRIHEETGSYQSVGKAIVTVPANFFDHQINGVLKTCEMADIGTEKEQARAAALAKKRALGKAVNAGVIIDEPSAATLYYLSNLETDPRHSGLKEKIASPKGLHLLIYDHGGGTLDITLAHVQRQANGQTGISVLTNRGNNQVGGDSIDLALMRSLLARAKAELPDLADRAIFQPLRKMQKQRDEEGWSLDDEALMLAARSQWKQVCEEVKITLSEEARADCKISPKALPVRSEGHFEPAPRPFETTVSKEDLEKISAELLAQCSKLVREVLDIAEVPPEEVDYILHTGRQSLMPKVRETVKAALPKLPESNVILDKEHLKVCVAKGAALYGLLKGAAGAAKSGVVFLDEGRRLPHAYGLDSKKGIAQLEFEPVVPKGSPYPTEQEHHIPAEEIEPDGWLTLKIYENKGSDNSIRGNREVRKIGQIRLDTLEDDTPGCDIVFLIDANRKLEVLADSKEVKITPGSHTDEEGWSW